MNKPRFGSALALSLAALVLSLATPAREAHAQTSGPTPAPAVAPSRSRAFVVNAGPMIGILGGGIYGRINLEWQMHRAPRYEGHAFNMGVAVVPWPNEGGPTIALAPRWQYDYQLVPGTLFFVSPYLGLDVGLGIFNLLNGGEARFRFFTAPIGGIDVKLLLGERLVLGFRPIGITVPVFIGGEWVTADVIYDIALTLGFRY